MATHEYGYNGTAQYADYLELEDNLNFALQAFDEDGLYYFLVVYTKLGYTTILEYGPMSCDDDIIPELYNVSQKKIEVDDKKVDDIINKFLQRKTRLDSHKKNPFDSSRKCKVVEVKEVTTNYALDSGIDIFKYLELEIGGKKDVQLKDN